ncbi:MAG: hypothetical protein HOP29_00315 [Phycisphaerales bacterium]|nr:hypothetical protein [Phycisphaerales bacterium]
MRRSVRARGVTPFVLVGSLFALATGAVIATSRPSASAALLRALIDNNHRVGTGHPVIRDLDVSNPFAVAINGATGPTTQGGGACGVPPDVFEQFAAVVLPPVASGPFVNFESPPVTPLALNADATRLYAVNTPNNSLLILDTTAGLNVIDDIPVGLDPVTVAVQPGVGHVWVANLISDNITVVDPAAGRVVATFAVGDEPVNILFDPAGQHAFVVIQGLAANDNVADPLNAREGHLVVVNAITHSIVSSTFLDCHTPRAAVYDPSNQRIVVAALHSGNNTTVVGEPVQLETTDPPPVDPPAGSCAALCNCTCVTVPVLQIARDFPPTAQIFADTLGPWPDLHDDPEIGAAAELVQRIIPDAGRNSGWKQIVDLLTDANGDPEPGMVAQMNAHFAIQNADQVIATMAADPMNSVDHDLVILNAADPAAANGLPIVAHVGGVGTTLTQMARRPTDGRLFLSNMEPDNTTRLVENLRGQLVEHQIVVVPDPLDPPSVVPHHLHAGIAGFQNVQIVNQPARDTSLANPLQIVFTPDGAVAFVAAFGPGRIGALNGANAGVLGRVDVGRGPRGLALDAAGDRLYVLNRTDMTISSVDVSNPADMTVTAVKSLFNPEPDVVKNGRDFLYSTRFSNNFASACATCHIDATLDHLAWDLGSKTGDLQFAPPPFSATLNNNPLKGPMVTQTLRGLLDHESFHWRGDKPQFQDFNEAFDNLLGGSELPASDIDAYTDFIHTVVHPPNPFYNRDHTFKDPDRGLCGMVPYAGSCLPCHQLNHDGKLPGSALNPPATTDVAGNFSGPPLFAQIQLVTQLRGIHRKFQSDKFGGFGLIHDGREERNDNAHPLITFLKQFFPNITPDDQLNMIAFMNAFPSNAMPVTGWQITAAGPLPAAATVADIDLMIAQRDKTPSHCDVVAHGLVAGVRHGYVYNNDDSFESELGDEQTLDQLLTALQTGDYLVFTAVPPGSGRRIGVDQDTDCVSDGVDPYPQHNDTGDADFDLDVDLDDFFSLAGCFALDSDINGPVSPECRAFDADCDGLLNAADAAAFISAYDGTLLNCNANPTTDLLDVLFGGSFDNNANATPDECESPVASALGPRYLSATPTELPAGNQPVAIRVTSDDFPCLNHYVDAAGRLVDQPFFQLPSQWGAVAVADSEVVPGAAYSFRGDYGGFQSAITTVQTPEWGNVNSAPGVDIFDILCVLDGFSGFYDVCALQAVDLVPAVPDHVIDIFDILAVLDAFSGGAYADPAPCDL